MQIKTDSMRNQYKNRYSALRRRIDGFFERDGFNTYLETSRWQGYDLNAAYTAWVSHYAAQRESDRTQHALWIRLDPETGLITDHPTNAYMHITSNLADPSTKPPTNHVQNDVWLYVGSFNGSKAAFRAGHKLWRYCVLNDRSGFYSLLTRLRRRYGGWGKNIAECTVLFFDEYKHQTHEITMTGIDAYLMTVDESAYPENSWALYSVGFHIPLDINEYQKLFIATLLAR